MSYIHCINVQRFLHSEALLNLSKSNFVLHIQYINCMCCVHQSLSETQLGKIQVELYKEIKKNGSVRSLRAALTRFAALCHHIRYKPTLALSLYKSCYNVQQ